MAERPGIMIYLDLYETLKDFTTEEAGQLFKALLEYGTTGTVPEFEDRGLRAVWRNAQQKIDRDYDKYLATVESRAYAAYCREHKRLHGERSTPLSKEEWKDQMTSDDVT